MFPLRWNFPFRKKDGSLSTIGDEIEEGGGYTLPTATAETKGGIKIGTNLTMEGEVLNADDQLPSYTSSENGKVLGVDSNGELEWKTPASGGVVDKVHMRYIVESDGDFAYYAILERDYIGPGRVGYEIETESTSSSAAKIKIYSVVYDETIKYKTLLKELTHNGTNTYNDGTISVIYENTNWKVTFTDVLENVAGTDYTSPLTWEYNATVDYVMLHPNN